MKKLRILILMSSVGGGHTSVAKALEEAFMEKGHEVVFFDALPSFLIPIYSILSRHLLRVWDFLFWTTNERRAAEVLAKLSNKITERKIAQKISFLSPDFIISDHPFITKLPKNILKKRPAIPLGVVVVDPVTVHEIWFKGNPDILFIPTEEMKNTALKAKVPREKIVYSGYPVKKEFYEDTEIKILRRYLGLEENLTTLMIGGSSEGIGEIEELCKKLSKFSTRIQFQAMIVCGRNKRLFRKLTMRYYFDRRFKIFGFENRMPSLIRATDLIISKAGPTNLYEAVAAKKPFIAFSAMPGQEEGNLDLIKREKIGRAEKDIEKISRLIKKWIKNPALLQEFEPGILRLRGNQKGAALRIVDFVENYLKNKKEENG